MLHFSNRILAKKADLAQHASDLVVLIVVDANESELTILLDAGSLGAATSGRDSDGHDYG